MRPKRLLVSDIDGTLLKDSKPTVGLNKLAREIEKRRGEVALVYATGRSFESTFYLIQMGILPYPDAIAPMVGTELWLPPFENRDPDYKSDVCLSWDRDRVTRIAKRFCSLELQPDKYQSPFKVSYYVRPHYKLFDIRRSLRESGLIVQTIYSCGRYLDIIPVNAGKRNAIQFLSRLWGVPSKCILTCGDSGNDLDMLTNPNTLNVAVRNAEKEVLDMAHMGYFYSSFLPFAAGLLEGAKAHRFWPQC